MNGKRATLLGLHLAELDDEASVLSRLVQSLLKAEELAPAELLETLVEIETSLLHILIHAKSASREAPRAADALETEAEMNKKTEKHK